MKLPAFAKVNLHLKILGKRPDGFHGLETLMVPVSLADDISVELTAAAGVDVVCGDPDVPVGDDNLVVRAAQAFSRHIDRPIGATISIEKRIPMGAGLGGGSSDAAAVLVALDRLLDTRLSTKALEEIAATLGSDIPFFIRGKPALCRGRGEIIEPCEFSHRFPLLLCKPPFGVETPWAYKNWAASQSLPDEEGLQQEVDGVALFNSLEKPVFEKFLLLPALKQWLRSQPEVRAAMMSGSGSTTFAVLHSGVDGSGLEHRVREAFGDGMWTAQCETLN